MTDSQSLRKFVQEDIGFKVVSSLALVANGADDFHSLPSFVRDAIDTVHEMATRSAAEFLAVTAILELLAQAIRAEDFATYGDVTKNIAKIAEF